MLWSGSVRLSASCNMSPPRRSTQWRVESFSKLEGESLLVGRNIRLVVELQYDSIAAEHQSEGRVLQDVVVGEQQ
eukprot:12892363-Prorocentrum_lima.AAC.1